MMFVLGPIVSEDVGLGQSDFFEDQNVTGFAGNEKSVTETDGR